VCVLQEHADLVLATRKPALGNGVQSISDWLDMRGLDRRLQNSDIVVSTSPRYDIGGITFHISHKNLLARLYIFDTEWHMGN
jgi:hypothetical protein